MPHRDETRLYSRSKSEVFEESKENLQRLYGTTEAPCSRDYFYKVWREHRPRLKPRTGGDFIKCSICAEFNATLLGAPGAPVTADDAVVRRTKEMKEAHLKLVRNDRDIIAKIEAEVLRSQQDLQPLSKVSIQADAAYQTVFTLPALHPPCHNSERAYSERQKIFAVYSAGNFVDFFLVPQTVGGGSNLIFTALHHSLTRILDKHTVGAGEERIEELFVQVDNCTGENKNHILLRHLGSLVGRGVIGKVEVNFMMVDHTHIKIGQVFSKISTHCKTMSIFTRKQQAAAFQRAYKELPVHARTLDSVGNFKALLMDAGWVRKIDGIKKPRSFELRRQGSHGVTVGMKEYMHSALFTGMSPEGKFGGPAPLLFREGVPCIEDAPPFVLKAVDKDVIAKVKARYRSVHTRVEALFPCDSEKQEVIKANMEASALVLEMTGAVKFNPPTHWLPVRGEELGAGKGSSRRSGEGSRGGHGGSPEEREGSNESPQGVRRLPPIGYLVFFAASSAPFVAAEVLETRTAENGTVEVHLHWWSPNSKTVREEAGKYSVAEYGKYAFGPDYHIDEDAVVASSRKHRRIPDTSWESANDIVVSCPRLRADNKIPRSVLNSLIAARSVIGSN